MCVCVCVYVLVRSGENLLLLWQVRSLLDLVNRSSSLVSWTFTGSRALSRFDFNPSVSQCSLIFLIFNFFFLIVSGMLFMVVVVVV